MVKISFDNITFLSLGYVAAFVVLACGQLFQCESIDPSLSITVCAGGERISNYWLIASFTFMLVGTLTWLYLNNKPNSDRP